MEELKQAEEARLARMLRFDKGLWNPAILEFIAEVNGHDDKRLKVNNDVGAPLGAITEDGVTDSRLDSPDERPPLKIDNETINDSVERKIREVTTASIKE